MNDGNANTLRVAHPALALLDDLGQFMADKSHALGGFRQIPARSEKDVRPRREGKRPDGRRLGPNMHPDSGEIGAERPFHTPAKIGREWLTGSAQADPRRIDRPSLNGCRRAPAERDRLRQSGRSLAGRSLAGRSLDTPFACSLCGYRPRRAGHGSRRFPQQGRTDRLAVNEPSLSYTEKHDPDTITDCLSSID